MIIFELFKRFRYETNDSLGNHTKQPYLTLFSFKLAIPRGKKISWNDSKYKETKKVENE